MATRRELAVEQIVATQATFAAKYIRGQRDRLLEIQVQLQRIPGDYSVEHVLWELDEVCSKGLKGASFYLTVCLKKAAQSGARLAPDPSFSDHDQLFVAVAASRRLPARPTTQAEAYARIQGALYAVKLLQEHILPCCINHLTDATGTGSSRIEETRHLLDRACTIVGNLAVDHIELAVRAISRFVHPKEVASNNLFADKYINTGWSLQEIKIKRALRGLDRDDIFKQLIRRT
jgi:hypothetical protein